jgi:phosphoribosylanthranilate isomerase
VVVGLGPSIVVVVADLEVVRVVEAARGVGASVVQLHGEESPADVAQLREQGPWEIWKALSVRGVEDALRGVDAYSGVVDGILLDGWHPHRRGGTGAVFSWKDVAAVRGSIPDELRLVAAGGLNPGNVEEAVRLLKPHVVDVSSGVEAAPGIKSAEKVSEFIQNAHRAGKRRSQ